MTLLPKPPKGTKTKFVLEHAFTVPAAEIVEAAKRAGFTITPGHISVIRTAERRRLREAPIKNGDASRSRTKRALVRPETGGHAKLTPLMAELGLQRCEELLAQLRTAARSL